MARFARFHTSKLQEPEKSIVVNPATVRTAMPSTDGFTRIWFGVAHYADVYGSLDDVLSELDDALSYTIVS